ncbi:peptidylprolyl isomerase [Paenibacillus sepulcri]|uniref:Peptidylprolyl isomerase n=1 Tax=Paenibacillus sepulcri TaxID=359917 RepID=A0ABS7BWU6_9BACL|nr:peptidylprolyl isomerase [Paenibacillus sepulcri]
MKKSIRPFVIGAVVGSLLTASSAVFADDGIQAIKAMLNKNTKITVNGKAATLANPTLTYDGKTYVYLKDIGKLVGASVNWNTKLKTIEIKTGAAAPGAVAEKVIATYSGGKVTNTEFAKYALFFSIVNPDTAAYLNDPAAKEQFLREYIGYKLLYGPVAGKPLSAEDQNGLTQFMEQYNAYIAQNAELKASNEKAGLAESDVKKFYTMITVALGSMQKKVTDVQIKSRFDQTKSDYNIVSVRHILVTTSDPQTGETVRTDAEALERANKVKGLLDDGGDWNELAKEYSDDPGSSGNGGLYENEQSNAWIAEFKDAANTQPIGTVGAPVKSDYGYHVIKVEKRDTKTFEQLSAEDKLEIKKMIAAEAMSNFMNKELPGKITKIDLA